MGKLSCDLVILFSSISLLTCVISIFQPWGGTSATNLSGITNAKYYLLSIVVEPKLHVIEGVTDAIHYAGHKIACPWNGAAVCYKFSTIDAFMAASAWEQFEHTFSLNGVTAGSTTLNFTVKN